MSSTIGVQNIAHTNGTVAATVDSGGNVGIGTSSPSSYSSTTLEVKGSSTTSAIKMTNSTTSGGDANGFDLEMNANDMNFVNRTSSGVQKFWTNSTERMRIDSSGNVVVGTTSSGQFTTSGENGIASANIGHVNGTASGYGYVIFRYNGTVIGRIDQNGTSGVSYNTSSDYRLKENVVTEWDATTRLKQLKPSRFNFIADADTTVDGFIAHEVQEIVPEAITGAKDALDADGNAVMQGIDQSKLVPLLVKTIQELEARITALEGA